MKPTSSYLRSQTFTILSMLRSLNYIPLAKEILGKQVSHIMLPVGHQFLPEQPDGNGAVLNQTLHWGCSRSGPLASIKLLDLAPQMISATVEPHAEPLVSQTYDTNPLWPCELMQREMGLAPPCLQGLGSPWRVPGLKMLLQPHWC